jgi:general secretion pathway protein L
MATSPEFPNSRSDPPGAAGRFWSWWRGEMLRLMPERLSLLRGASGAPLVLVQGDEAVVIDAQAPSGTAEKRADLGSLDEGRRRAAVRTMLESVGETRVRARAALSHDEALVRRVSLPAATEENLGNVLAFEMDRFSPFQADEVYFDHRVVSRDAATGQIGVELAIARREAVDARVRQLRDLGVSVQGVGLRDDAGRSAVPFDLLPSEQRGERETARERVARNVLIGVAMLLFAAALFVPVWQKRNAVLQMLPVVEKARLEAQATDAIVRELERQAGDYNFVLARKHSWYPLAAYLEELSKVLPDNTWLQVLDMKSTGKAKELTITGETASASKLIELLEQSKMLQNATPRGPTTRGTMPGTERFMIAADLRPRTPPEAQPLTAGMRPAPPTAASQPAVPPAAPFPAAAPPPAPAAPKAQPTPQSAPIPPPAAFGPYPQKQ